MSKEFRSSEAFQALREKAETMVRNDEVQLSEEDELDLVRLSHELEVQRVKLELQNEELRSANRQLEASRNEFADLYQSAPVPFLTLSAKGLVEQANEAAVRMLADEKRRLAKHSGAEFAEIELEETEAEILLKVEDNGCGFDSTEAVDTPHPLQGYGMISMKERVEICKGRFEVKSEPGRGSLISASIPKALS